MSEYIQKRLDGVLFSFYTKEEIRKLSVVEVSNPVAIDSLNKPLKKGLYDPAMGISPYDKNSRCITCGQEGLDCTGHMGHIELSFPVYNPLTLRFLHRLLRAMCLNCHKIRIPEKRIDDFSVMLLLIKLGYVTEKFIYEKACNIRNVKKSKKEEKEASESDMRSIGSLSTKTSANPSRNTSRKTSEAEDKDVILINAIADSEDKKKEIKKTIKKLTNIKNNPNFQITEPNSTMVRATKETIQDVWSSVMSLKCPHCGTKPSNVKLDMNTKFIIENKTDKEKVGKVLHTKKGYENVSDEDENEDEDEEEREKKKNEKMAGIKKDTQQIFLNSLEVKEHIRLLYENNSKLLNLIFGNLVVNAKTIEKLKKGYKIISNPWETFFLEVVPVTPNRFRPENKMGENTFLHEHTVLYSKILQTNSDIKALLIKHKQPEAQKKKKEAEKEKQEQALERKNSMEEEINDYERTELTDTIRLWIQLQDATNTLIDSSKAMKLQDREVSGIRQLLERKEGLFRMKMMGKRVNYSARSVISPDPYIDTNEVGVPMYVAKTLTFPESVNEYNIEKLRRLINNGAQKWPGANYLEENGVKIALDTRTEAQRQAIAKTLMHNYRNKVVYRHLQSGDVMLFNRQPTLHKASIMSHIARVLPKENTIRNHYANCNTYNADFDGDEMNLHLLQNHLARAEAYTVSNTANQYISPTHGKPLRGLIQDSIVSGFFLTIRGNFLEKSEYQQLVYSAVWNVMASKKKAKIILLKPAILKPRPLWTGKQVISSVIKTIIGSYNQDLNQERIGLYMTAKARVKLEDVTKRRVIVDDPVKGPIQKTVFDEVVAEESLVVINDNELIQGVIDKNQIGNSEFGMVHAYYELYGGAVTETLLTCLTRLLLVYLQFHGQTCGIDDLKMDKDFEKERKELIDSALREGLVAAANFAGVKPKLPEGIDLNNRPSFEYVDGKYSAKVYKREADVDYISAENPIVHALHKKLIFEKNGFKDFDNHMKPVMGKQTSTINSSVLPIGLEKQFPQNFFSVIVATGAKGSNVNQNQVSGLLSQQELEGRRVPVLASGKTLPCFLPYDPNPRSWGYITDRFISGVRPADFYFHCMAGREGLIDTAVKTSVSGYLQRCLVKNMETLIINYDFTVRDNSDGSVIQFYYGEDALDTTKTKYIDRFDFIEKNINGYIEKYNPNSLANKVDQKAVKKFLKQRKNMEDDDIQQETIMNKFFPGSYFGAVSENMLKNVTKYIKENFKPNPERGLTKKRFKSLVFVKYYNSLMHPGECVGALVAQAIGEPSTQMTLNTFHLAGHGGANVTLGIPRLREILFKGPRKVKTPMMTLTLKLDDGREIKKRDAELITRKLQKLKLKELVKSIQVKEIRHLVKDGKVLSESERCRMYHIAIKLEDANAIRYSFDLTFDQIKEKIQNLFMYHMFAKIGKELKKSKHGGAEIAIQKVKEGEEKKAIAADGDAAEESEEDEEPEENKEKDKKKKAQKKSKDIMDEAKLAQYRQYYGGLSYDKEGNHHIVNVIAKVPLDSKKLLMINLVESVISEVCISEVPGINNCHLSSENKDVKGVKKEIYKIITEGVNFPAMWNFDFIDKNSIDCNDVSEIYSIYGVEATRTAIVREVARVFKPYGITVDYRHVSLMSDFITYNGRIRPLTREGMKEFVSPLQKMSFEMASRFLTEAAVNSEYDASKTASAKIVLGRAPALGTGMFDVMHKLEEEIREQSDEEEMDQE